jgi:hypothetical protein
MGAATAKRIPKMKIENRERAQNRSLVSAAFATAALMTALLGCKPKQPVTSQPITSPTAHSEFMVSGYAKGHEITADIDGAGGLLSKNGRTFIQLPGHELDVQEERLLLDGKEVAKIPAASRLEIVLSGTILMLKANGSNVAKVTIQR